MADDKLQKSIRQLVKEPVMNKDDRSIAAVETALRDFAPPDAAGRQTTGPRGGGNGPEATPRTPPPPNAEELARFIEKNADEILADAQKYQVEAKQFADEIRKQSALEMERQSNFREKIKDAQRAMAEARERFVGAKQEA